MIRLIIIFNLILSVFSSKIEIPIGGIFAAENHESELIFRRTIDRLNILERKFTFVPYFKYVNDLNTFKVQKAVCQFASIGVAAIFGPPENRQSGVVESICSNLTIPHFLTQWKPEEVISKSFWHPKQMTLNLYPDSNLYALALSDALISLQWKTYSIVYETDEGLMRLKDIIQIHEPDDPPLTIYQLTDDGDYRPLFKKIKKSGEDHVILDCDPAKVTNVLHQAKEVGMMGEYNSYMITSLNSHTIDFSDFKSLQSNITMLRMYDVASHSIKFLANDVTQIRNRVDKSFSLTAQEIKTESILIHDAMTVLADGVREILMYDDSEDFSVPINDCSNATEWPLGIKLVKLLKGRFRRKIKMEGLTGGILFGNNGNRIEFHLEIVELSPNGGMSIAEWFPGRGVKLTRSDEEAAELLSRRFEQKTFVVASRTGPPYLMYRKPKAGETLVGNNRFEGYSLDLIDGISKILKFNYVIELVPDNKYGSMDKDTKEWDGLVRHLLDRKADLAICDLTITYERRSAVDFTMPFMTLGISILFAKPTKQPPGLFAFFTPLSLDVWIYMATAYLGVTLFIFIVARMAPDEWENPHPCNSNPEELENIWTIANCTWLAVGSLMGQGSDLLPKSVSARLVTGLWWFFALIMLSSYTANLAAFLTKEQMDVTISSAEELAGQSKIKYGVVDGGSTQAFFKNSNHSTYQKMWTTMESVRPSVFTKGNPEGIERVEKGKRLYAFLMESTSIQYIVERNCNLTQIGGWLDSKGYGIAMPFNSRYRTAISGAVLKMQEGGQLLTLKTKWWKEMHGGGACKEEKKVVSDAQELGFSDVGGVFVVLLLGCLTGLFIGIIEFLWNIKTIAVEERITPWEAFKAEVEFAAKFWITTKPVHKMSKSSTESLNKSKSRERSESIPQLTTNMIKRHNDRDDSIMDLDKFEKFIK